MKMFMLKKNDVYLVNYKLDFNESYYEDAVNDPKAYFFITERGHWTNYQDCTVVPRTDVTLEHITTLPFYTICSFPLIIVQSNIKKSKVKAVITSCVDHPIACLVKNKRFKSEDWKDQDYYFYRDLYQKLSGETLTKSDDPEVYKFVTVTTGVTFLLLSVEVMTKEFLVYHAEHFFERLYAIVEEERYSYEQLRTMFSWLRQFKLNSLLSLFIGNTPKNIDDFTSIIFDTKNCLSGNINHLYFVYRYLDLNDDEDNEIFTRLIMVLVQKKITINCDIVVNGLVPSRTDVFVKGKNFISCLEYRKDYLYLFRFLIANTLYTSELAEIVKEVEKGNYSVLKGKINGSNIVYFITLFKELDVENYRDIIKSLK